MKYYWCQRWQIGQPQGQDIQRVKSRTGMAGYLGKYITKAWPAIPQWILKRTCMRLVGFSKSVNDLLGVMSRPKPNPSGVKRKRPIARLIDRIPSSQLCCNVIGSEGFLGVLHARVCDLLDIVGAWGLICKEKVFYNKNSIVKRKYLFMIQPSLKKIQKINRDLDWSGFTDLLMKERESRKVNILESWKRGQLDLDEGNRQL